MQKTYLLTLYKIAQNDPRVMLLLADSGSGYDGLFQEQLPKQIFDFGIAEENMVAAAAGMASCGKIPFVYTAGAFLAYRSMEFIRDDVCLQKRNVKLIGMGTGFAWSTLGATHHTTEDLGVLRSMPNLCVLSPSTPKLAGDCVLFAYEHEGPVYIRLGMGGERELYSDIVFNVSQNIVAREGTDILILSTGVILSSVLNAANRLSALGFSVEVMDVISIFPFDEIGLLKAAQGKKVIFTVEEHNVIGGIGSAVAEILTEKQFYIPLFRIGLQKMFAQGYGTHDEVRKQNGLDADGIFERITSILQELNE